MQPRQDIDDALVRLRSSYFGSHCIVLVVSLGSFSLVLVCARGGLQEDGDDDDDDDDE